MTTKTRVTRLDSDQLATLAAKVRELAELHPTACYRKPPEAGACSYSNGDVVDDVNGRLHPIPGLVGCLIGNAARLAGLVIDPADDTTGIYDLVDCGHYTPDAAFLVECQDEQDGGGNWAAAVRAGDRAQEDFERD